MAGKIVIFPAYFKALIPVGIIFEYFFQVKDMLVDCDMRKGDSCTGNSTAYDGIHLIYAGGHCHAPSCISMELFNADTGKLLCRHDPVYGQSDKV